MFYFPERRGRGGASRERSQGTVYGWIMYTKEESIRNREYIQLYRKHGEEMGIGIELVLYEPVLSWNGQGIRKLKEVLDRERPAFAINRTRDARLAEQLEKCGLRVFNNSRVADLGNDKAKAYRFMERHGIPIMPTWTAIGCSEEEKKTTIGRSMEEKKTAIGCSMEEKKTAIGCSMEDRKTAIGYSEEEAGIAIRRLAKGNGMPLVVKSRWGHGGTEVFLLPQDRMEEFIQYGREKEFGRADGECWEAERFSGAALDKPWKRMELKDCVVQQAASDLGKDVRVYVIGNKIVQAVLRTSAEDFRSNFSLGGRAELYGLSTDERQLVERILSLLSIDYAAIDFIFDHGKMVFNEMEDMAGARMLYSLTDYDIVKDYVEYIGRVMWNGHI